MDHRRYGGLPNQSEATLCQILQEAQHRWLRPPEVCEILRNYQKFQLTPDPPQKPQSGSLFLFDRKALRYFRKDGHNWRKKKDGKTVREAHERLKAGSVEVLHCYYAHGEDNENFQRRSYWMLDHNEHIVLVHYREVKEGGRGGMRSPTSYSVDTSSSVGNTRAASGISPQTSPLVSPRSSSPNTSADWNGPTYSPECDEPESSDDTDQSRIKEQNGKVYSSAHKAMIGSAMGRPASSVSATIRDQNGVKIERMSPPISNGVKIERMSPPIPTNIVNGPNGSAYPVISGVQGPPTVNCKLENGIATPSGGLDLLEWCEVLKQGNSVGNQGNMMSHAGLHNQAHDRQGNIAMTEGVPTTYSYNTTKSVKSNGIKAMQSIQVTQSLPGFESHSQCHVEGYPDVVGGQNSNMGSWNAVLAQLVDNTSYQKSVFDTLEADLLNTCQQTESQNSQYILSIGSEPVQQPDINRFVVPSENKEVSLTHSYSNVFRDFQAEIPTQHDESDTFRKYDSFGRWMSQDIGAYMDNSILDSTFWASTLAEEGPSLIQHMQVDNSSGMPVPHTKYFSITDFSPCGALSTSNTKVIIVGTFTDAVKDPPDWKWSVMFGDVEVSAEVLQPGVLRCNVPYHKPGKVPFYITRDTKIPCSEVKEFEYYSKISSQEYTEGNSSYKRDLLFQLRLARLLSKGVSVSNTSTTNEMQGSFKSLALFEEWELLEDELTMSGMATNIKEQFIQKILKEKLQTWLLRRSQDDGKGAAVLDDHGLGVLHMGAALGYTWIIAPMLAAGVNVNFRDSRGWTALHWAAYRGREAMVVELMANGAAPGAKTDPTSAFPAGQTPADLASAEHHKGIAGYLAESSLTTHLSSLTLKANVNGNIDAVDTLSEKTIAQPSAGQPEEQLPLQDTLAAVRNAAQAAARIHSAFRVQSFKRKEELQRSQEDEYGISNEEAQYIVAVRKSNRAGLLYEDDEICNSAAIRIQQQYRGWKGRKDFLFFRQNVVKIQAHFRGHQVRKKYKKIIWSVSIVEKAILRWRRKGKGLRGFESVKPAIGEQNDADDDFLKAGRKQIEAGLEKALARVQSMVKSPEAQEQYRRLLEGYQKTKTHFEGSPCGEVYLEDQPHTEDFPMSTYT